MAVRPSISYIFKDRCSLEVFDWVQTQPGATEVSESADKSLPALYRQPNVSHPPVAPGEITFTLKGGGDVLILTLQRKPSPLTSPCPKSADVEAGWWRVCFVSLILGRAGPLQLFQAWGMLGPTDFASCVLWYLQLPMPPVLVQFCLKKMARS